MSPSARRPPPLAGCTVVVTRARADATSFVEALGTQGATVLLAPCVRIVRLPLTAARRRRVAAAWQRAQLVALSSRHAVAALCDLIDQMGGQWPPRRPLAAVGPATAAALWARQRRRAWVAEPATAGGLVARVGRALGPRARGQLVFLPQSLLARPELAAGLARLGMEVAAEPLYTTHLVRRPLPAAVGQADVVVLASPSAWRGFCAAGGQRLGHLRFVAWGPTTAAAMLASGRQAEAVVLGSATADLGAAVQVAWQARPPGARPGPVQT